MFTVKTKTTDVSFSGVYDEITINGNYKIGENGGIREVNGSLSNTESGIYLGGFNVYLEGETLKLNKHGIDMSNTAAVDSAVDACITDIKAEL